MKKIFVLGMALLMVVGFSAVSMAVITGSDHDFSGKTWNNNGNGEICQVCHTPHNADTSVADAPLWNHEVTTSNFTVYSSPTMDATDKGSQPSGSSKLCLSCHDGTVAIDNFGTTTNGNASMGSDNLIGTNLSDDHPISFTYNADLATTDGGLYNPATTNTSLGKTIEADLLFGATDTAKLECASCHDVHNAAGNSKLLRIANTTSELCLTCHNK